MVVPPGDLVKVQVPDDGKLLKSTLPVEVAQVGCVIVPTEGAEGVTGCELITTLEEDGEVEPAELVTVYVYVPVLSPEIVVVTPVPVVVVPPGVLVNVQVPTTGRPLKTTLPVDDAQVGCVIAPTIGAVGGGLNVGLVRLEVVCEA